MPRLHERLFSRALFVVERPDLGERTVEVYEVDAPRWSIAEGDPITFTGTGHLRSVTVYHGFTGFDANEHDPAHERALEEHRLLIDDGAL